MEFIPTNPTTERFDIMLYGNKIGTVRRINESFGKWQAGITNTQTTTYFYSGGTGETKGEAVRKAIVEGIETYKEGVEFFESLRREI